MIEKPKAVGPLRTTLRRRKQLEQDLEHVTQEMYRRNLELAETNQMLTLLRIIDSYVLESHDDIETLSQRIAQAITENSNFPFVAFFSGKPQHKELSLLGFHSTVPGGLPELEKAKISIDASLPWLSSLEKQVIISTDSLEEKTISDHLDATPSVIKTLYQSLHFPALVILKLITRQKLVGLMVVGLTSNDSELSEKEQYLVGRLGEAVGIALDNKLLYEENQRVLNQLKKTNEKLKALDETKDEFISMASHQLRTPLTSVKGYLSMVLEGDTGKITSAQRKMLDQAFTSSQRMVYLIADLLNVSRLRTGKFIIEPIATNLSEVVEGELDQLKETAASRGLKLTYQKPKEFPVLMLDETKVRQVIMNFVDNAIYYTPSGGQIKVELKNLNKSVEFTVTDNGLGVPKADQHHLFNKFYRAGNARKARPDGTGLGLFMAKKVIIAQGGSIIFKSQEGKGSTFGFSFPKAKLLPPKITNT